MTSMRPFLLTLTAVMLTAQAVRAVEIVVDNDDGAPGYAESGTWLDSTWTGYDGGTYRWTSDNYSLSTATWAPDLPVAARYEVSVVFRRGSNRSAGARYTIESSGGATDTVTVDQSGDGLSEIVLGDYLFDAGRNGEVRLDNTGSSGAFIADAVIFRSAENGPPVFGEIVRNPEYPPAGQAVRLSVPVSDETSVAWVRLSYSASPSGAAATVDAYDDGAHGDGAAGDGVWGASIPAFTDGETVTYSFEAEDSEGLSSSSEPQVYTVGDTGPREYRVLWIDSWNTGFLNASQVDTLVATCRARNINTIMPEIRKVGDAYYDSSLEPRATNISGGSSFDPLGYLVQECHDTSGGKERIEVHAWFVMQRLWTGGTLPSGHVLRNHPEYTMLDSTGSSGTGTMFMDPGHPDAVDHNVAVIVDCVENYAIDGVNLDYIRYPEAAGEWGYNAQSVARFNDVYGKSGQPSGTDPDWDDWRRECVTLQVRKIYVKTAMVDPEIVVTADTVNWGSSYGNFPASSAYASVFQNWVRWLEDGILDYNALMDYSTSTSRFQGWANLSLNSDDGRGSIIGIGAYLQSSVQDSMDQLLWTRSAGAEGLNIYDWGSEVNAAPESRTEFYNALESQVYPDWVDPPGAPWKITPTTVMLEGIVTADDAAVDHAAVSLDGVADAVTVSDGNGWYGLIDLPPGDHVLRVTAAPYGTRTVSVSLPMAGEVVTVDVNLTPPASSYLSVY